MVLTENLWLVSSHDQSWCLPTCHIFECLWFDTTSLVLSNVSSLKVDLHCVCSFVTIRVMWPRLDGIMPHLGLYQNCWQDFLFTAFCCGLLLLFSCAWRQAYTHISQSAHDQSLSWSEWCLRRPMVLYVVVTAHTLVHFPYHETIYGSPLKEHFSHF